MKLLKFLSILFVLLVGLNVVSALSTNYDITDIKLNGLDITGATTVYVERGETVNIDVALIGTGDVNDVRIKAWIGGYEYEDVEAKTALFDVQSGITYLKNIKLEVPDDIDASQNYTLHILSFDSDDEEEQSYNLKLNVKEVRHKLDIQDIILRPEDTIEAGRPLFVVVRVENMGAKKENDIKIKVSIPELGVSARDYIDELVAVENNDDEETSASSKEILLRIPADAETGNYDVNVEVEYNRGHDVIKKTTSIYVEGTKEKVVTEEEKAETIVSIDTTSKQIGIGEEVTYKLMFANLGKAAGVYSVEVAGTQLWADSRVEPSFITIAPDASGEVYVYIKAKDNAELGRHAFTLKVMSGTTLVKEINLMGEVISKAPAKKELGNLKLGIEIAFGVLVLILVILALIFALRKGGRETKTEEPMISNVPEGQSYY